LQTVVDERGTMGQFVLTEPQNLSLMSRVMQSPMIDVGLAAARIASAARCKHGVIRCAARFSRPCGLPIPDGTLERRPSPLYFCFAHSGELVEALGPSTT
jgi:hypothetical protein